MEPSIVRWGERKLVFTVSGSELWLPKLSRISPSRSSPQRHWSTTPRRTQVAQLGTLRSHLILRSRQGMQLICCLGRRILFVGLLHSPPSFGGSSMLQTGGCGDKRQVYFPGVGRDKSMSCSIKSAVLTHSSAFTVENRSYSFDLLVFDTYNL